MLHGQWLIAITKSVKKMSISLFDVVYLALGIVLLLNVQFPCSLFELVKSSCVLTSLDNLLNSSLDICAFKLINLQQKLKKFSKLFLLI